VSCYSLLKNNLYGYRDKKYDFLIIVLYIALIYDILAGYFSLKIMGTEICLQTKSINCICVRFWQKGPCFMLSKKCVQVLCALSQIKQRGWLKQKLYLKKWQGPFYQKRTQSSLITLHDHVQD